MSTHHHLCIKCNRPYPCSRIVMRCTCGRDDACESSSGSDRSWCKRADEKFTNICARRSERRSVCDACLAREVAKLPTPQDLAGHRPAQAEAAREAGCGRIC